jgi:predicted Zn finger-like uncharacterized protein
MASELVSCPECQRKLRVPKDLVGKLVKCPTCGQTFNADPAVLAPPPAPAPVVEQKPTRTSKVSRDDREYEDDDEERSRRRRLSSRRDDDDEDDRPRRRRSRRDDDEDEDDDDRPRRRRDFVPHRGSAVLTMGIMGLVLTFVPVVPLAGLVLGIVAWVMGNTDLPEIRAGRMDPEGEGPTNGGRICGMVAVILHIVGVVVVLAFFTCMCAGMGAAGRH